MFGMFISFTYRNQLANVATPRRVTPVYLFGVTIVDVFAFPLAIYLFLFYYGSSRLFNANFIEVFATDSINGGLRHNIR